MIVIPPVPVTPAMLISSNAVDEPAWAAGTTYALGAVTSRNHRKWESLQAGNVGKTPETEPLWWRESGASNRMAAFDASPSTVTQRAGGLTMTIATGRRFTDLALMGIRARRATLTLRDGPGGEIFYGPDTRTAITSGGTYWAFCFSEIEEMPMTTDMGWHDLPSLAGAHVTIELAGLAQTHVALVVLGRGLDIGEAVYGFANKFDDRSRYYTGPDNNPVSIDRGHTKGASGVVEATRQQYNSLIKFSGDYVGVPCVWVPAPGDSSLSGAMTYGRFSSVSVGISGPTHTTYSLDISGNV